MKNSRVVRRVALCFGVVALLLGAASCGEEDATTSEATSSDGGSDVVSAELDGAGGELTHGSGAVLVVPEGALGGVATLSVAKADASALAGPPTGWTVVGDVFAFTPHGQVFEVAATVRLPFAGDATRARVVRLSDASDTSWEEIAGATFQGGQATFLTTSFSYYAVAEGEGASANNSTSTNNNTATNNNTSTNNGSTSTNSGTTAPENNSSTQPGEPDPEPSSKPGG